MRFKSLFLLSFFVLQIATTAFAQNQDRLIFAVDVIRHGDRTPISGIPSAPYNWAEGPGQLTTLGMQQEFQLGSAHRNEYIVKNNLLPERYQYNTLAVYSTDVDRTLMSAESFLLGMYPLRTGATTLPHEYQPIPIHPGTKALQEALASKMNDKDLKSLTMQYMSTRQDWQDKTHELEGKFASWSKLTGTEIKSLYDLMPLSDTLFIDQIHHVAYPTGMSEGDAQEIIDAGHWAYATMYKPHQIGDATMRPLLGIIADFLQQGSQQKSALRWVLLSAHDSTLLGLMSALQTPLDVPPHYASNLNFALYQKHSGEYYVKVTYNDTPVVLPACGAPTCSLQQFMNAATSTGSNK